MSRLGPTGLTQLLTNIKTWVTTKLGNYVTTDTTQTVTGKKLFTASAIQLDNVTSMYGSTMFIDTSASAPRGEFPAETHRVGRIYIGDGQSYNGAWFIVDPIINTNSTCYRMVTTNPDNTDSTRFSIVWDSTKEGVRRRRNVSSGDLLPSGASTYNLGELGNAWQDAYINKIHGISDFANITSVTLNANTTLTHAVHGRRIIAVTGTRTLTLPAPENGSWFLIKALDHTVTINPPAGTTIASYPDNAQSIIIKAGGTVLLTYNGETEYCCVYTTGNSTALVGRTDSAPSDPKNWFRVASCVCKTTYSDPTISFKVYISHSGNTIGTLTAHCRIDNTVGVTNTANTFLQWQECGEGITLNKYALTTKDVSGTSVTIELWCKLEGGYASAKFVRIIEHDITDNINKPVWLLTPNRQADGDLAELSDTDFTNIVYSTLTTLKNNTAGKANNVTGTVSIANGGTGATTRLNAVKALTNESVGTPTHFLAITTNWGKAGYTTVAQAKTVLGITGDIVSHNASEFLTAHQSLANYVTTNTDQDIEGNKNFKGLLTTIPSSSLWPSVSNTSDDITLLGGSVVHVEQKSSGKLTDLSGGAWNVVELGAGAFFFRNNTGTDIRYKHLYTGVVNRIPVVSGANRFINDVTPNENDTYSLGTSSLRWSSCYSNAYYLGTTAFGDIVTHNASEFLTAHPTIAINSVPVSQPSVKLQNGDTFTYVSYVNRDANGHADTVYTTTATLRANIPQRIATRTSSGTWTISGVPKGSILYINGYITLDPDNIYHADSYDVTLIFGAEMLVGRGMSDTMASAHSGNNIVSNTLGMILLVNGTGASGTRDVTIELSNGASYLLYAYQ